MAEPDTLQITGGDASLFTTAYRKPDAETVILLHGGPGVPMDESPLAEILRAKYQVVSFDQRGTGRSAAEGSTYSLEEYVDDLSRVADAFEVERFHLFGHSWGGLYAQIYAQRQPGRIRSLFLCSPSSGTGELWKQTEREVMAFNRRHAGTWGWTMMGLQSLLGMFGSDRAYRSVFKRVYEHYHRDYIPGFEATEAMVERVRAAPVNKTRPHLVAHPPLETVEDPPFPVQIVYGEHDIYGESRHAVPQRYPSANVVEVEAAGHVPWIHAPQRFREVMTEFYGLPD